MDDEQRRAPALDRRTVLLLGAAAALGACAPAATSSSSSAPTTDGAPSTPSTTSAPSSTPTSVSPEPTADAPAATGPAVEVVHGPRSSRDVALTFHGQGDPALATRVLDVARSHGAHITVLGVGTWLEAEPAVARAILDGGHELGNHTLHHRPMRTMSESTAYAEILGGRSAVHRYSSAAHWFRPSGTPHATPAILAAAGRAGYRTSLSFDVDPADYTDPGAGAVVTRVLRDVRGGSIVSLHLGHAGTAAALPRILDGLGARGLSAVTVSQLLVGVAP